MTRKKVSILSGHTILLVDDNSDYVTATKLLLEREGHTVYTAASGTEALDFLRHQAVELLLLDYFMPGMTGEDVVTEMRKFNQIVQIVLQTGYASEKPPLELLRRLDIQGYYDKAEGPDKLLLWAEVGLKAAYTLQLLTKGREGLRYILDITPDLHKIQSLSDLFQGILLQVTGLLNVVNSFIAVFNQVGIQASAEVSPDGFLAMEEEYAELVIKAATGRFSNHTIVSEILDADKTKMIYTAIQHEKNQPLNDMTIMPLRVGKTTIGVIYLDRQVFSAEDNKLLNIFANQAAVAIQNAQLYELATIDKLTDLYIRSFFEKCLYREIRAAFRSQQPVSLLMVDIDELKKINDTAGHLVGDQALRLVGKILRQSTRDTDVLGRYGGDEFVILLPQTHAEQAQIVGRRILTSSEGRTLDLPGNLTLYCSLGLSMLEPHDFAPMDIPHPIPPMYFEDMAHLLIKQADDALYQSKKKGGNQLCIGNSLRWTELAHYHSDPK